MDADLGKHERRPRIYLLVTVVVVVVVVVVDTVVVLGITTVTVESAGG